MRNRKPQLPEWVRPEYFFWLAALGAFFLFIAPQNTRVGATSTEATALRAIQEPRVNPYEKVEVGARAAYVYDALTRQALFQKNAEEILPLASITKIMTAVAALSVVPETTEITISKDVLEMEGDSGLKVGERFILRDLLTFMLLKSSNDAAAAVSSSIGK